MIELAFNESTAGALKFAKSMKLGDVLNGATAVIGGTKKERREAIKPRVWAGYGIKGDPLEVACLSLMLDMGELSDINGEMDGRKALFKNMFGHYPGVPESMWETAQNALVRLLEARKTLEPVRMWACMENPAELCGVCFVCGLMKDVRLPLSCIWIPKEDEDGKQITRYQSTAEVDAEKLGKYAEEEQQLTCIQKGVYSNDWSILARENAPLRAVVNGRLMSVDEVFYDGFIRAHMPKESCSIGMLIGKTLSELPGVSDFWLYARIREMIEDGEIVIVSGPKDEHPYSARIALKA